MTSKTILPLKTGDLVDIVSPGSSSRSEDVELCLDLLHGWGLKTRLPKETFKAHPFHSNEDEVRLRLFKNAIQAKDSKAVWCLRGGYGANRLIPELWKMKPPAKPKMLIGYSDITTLHILMQKWKWTSYHGPLLETLVGGRLKADQIEECREIIFGEKTLSEFHLKPLNPKAQKLKSIQAPVMAGNLVVLESGIGTGFAGRFSGKFLAVEEVGERGYRIDRMLEHFKQSGQLKGCLGIIFGDFLFGDERDGMNFVQYALDRFAAENSIACFSGLEMGHGTNNRMIALGPKARLEKNILFVPSGIAIENKPKAKKAKK
jgi:muramoyltetrapeptide carboxypeptidase